MLPGRVLVLEVVGGAYLRVGGDGGGSRVRRECGGWWGRGGALWGDWLTPRRYRRRPGRRSPTPPTTTPTRRNAHRTRRSNRTRNGSRTSPTRPRPREVRIRVLRMVRPTLSGRG